jgi:hypothetical protein
MIDYLHSIKHNQSESKPYRAKIPISAFNSHLCESNTKTATKPLFYRLV